MNEEYNSYDIPHFYIMPPIHILKGFKMNNIVEFKGEYDFLSNFYMRTIRINSEIFPSTEHYYQAMKARFIGDEILFERIRTEMNPGNAKEIARGIKLPKYWHAIKIDIMTVCVNEKFMQHKDLREKLIETKNVELIEGNWWRDDFWGVYEEGVGKNHLGKILMKVRKKIRLLLKEGRDDILMDIVNGREKGWEI